MLDLRIREDPTQGFHVEGLQQVEVESIDDLQDFYREGETRRHVAATDINELSSRSHTIFTIYVEQKSAEESSSIVINPLPRIRSRLSLVDLAGSENVRLTNAEGERLKEGGLINKSLLSLRLVISSLAKSDPHIKFRDSKLTQILQPCLYGNCRSALICCVSPASIFVQETTATLNLALSAKKIQNRYSVNQVLEVIRAKKAEQESLLGVDEEEEVESIPNTSIADTSIEHTISDELRMYRIEKAFADELTHLCQQGGLDHDRFLNIENNFTMLLSDYRTGAKALENLENQISEFKRKHQEKLADKINNFQAEITRLNSQVSEQTSLIKDMETQISLLNSDLELKAQAESRTNLLMTGLETELLNSKNELKSSQVLIKQYQDNLQQVNKKTQFLEQQYQSKLQEEIVVSQALGAVRTDYEGIKSKSERLEKELNGSKRIEKQLQSKIKDLESKIFDATKETKLFEEEITHKSQVETELHQSLANKELQLLATQQILDEVNSALIEKQSSFDAEYSKLLVDLTLKEEFFKEEIGKKEEKINLQLLNEQQLQQTIRLLKEQLEITEREKVNFQDNFLKEIELSKVVQNENLSIQKELDMKNMQISTLADEIKALQASFEKVSDTLSENQQSNKLLMEEKTSLRQIQQDLSIKNQTLEQELSGKNLIEMHLRKDLEESKNLCLRKQQDLIQMEHDSILQLNELKDLLEDERKTTQKLSEDLIEINHQNEILKEDLLAAKALDEKLNLDLENANKSFTSLTHDFSRSKDEWEGKTQDFQMQLQTSQRTIESEILKNSALSMKIESLEKDLMNINQEYGEFKLNSLQKLEIVENQLTSQSSQLELEILNNSSLLENNQQLLENSLNLEDNLAKLNEKLISLDDLAKKSKEDFLKKIELLEEDLHTKESFLEQNQVEISKLKDEIVKLNDINQKFHDTTADLKSQLQSMGNLFIEEKERYGELLSTKESLLRGISDLNSQLNESQDGNVKLQGDLEIISNLLNEERSRSTVLLDKTQEFSDQIETLSLKKTQLEEDLTEAINKFELLKFDLETNSKLLEEERVNSQNLSASNNYQELQMSKLDDEIKQLKLESESVKQQLDNEVAQVRNLNVVNLTLQQALETSNTFQNDLTEKVSFLTSENLSLKESIRGLEKENEEKLRQLIIFTENLESEQSKSSNLLIKTEEQDVKLTMFADENESLQKQLAKDREEAKIKISDLNSQNSQLTQDLEILNCTKIEIEKELVSKIQIFSALEAQKDALEKQTQELTKEVDLKSIQSKNLNGTILKLNEEISQLNENFNSKISELETEKQNLSNFLNQEKHESFVLREDLERLRNEHEIDFTDLQNKYLQEKSKSEQIFDELSSLKVQSDEAVKKHEKDISGLNIEVDRISDLLKTEQENSHVLTKELNEKLNTILLLENQVEESRLCNEEALLQLRESQEKNDNLNKQLESSKAALDLVNEALEAVKLLNERLELEKSKLETENVDLRDSVEALSNQVSALKEDLIQSNRQCSDFMDKVNGYENMKKEYLDRISDLEQKQRASKDEIQSLSNEKERLHLENKESLGKLIILEEEKGRFVEESQKLSEMFQVFSISHSTTESQLNSEISLLTEENSKLQNEIQSANQQLSSMENYNSLLNTELDDAKSRLKIEINARSIQNDELNDVCTKLNDELKLKTEQLQTKELVLEQLREQLNKFETSVSGLESEKIVMINKLQALERAQIEGSSRLSALNSSYEIVTLENNELATKVQVLTMDLVYAKKTYSELSDDMKKLQDIHISNLSSNKRELDELILKNQDLEELLHASEEQILSLQDQIINVQKSSDLRQLKLLQSKDAEIARLHQEISKYLQESDLKVEMEVQISHLKQLLEERDLEAQNRKEEINKLREILNLRKSVEEVVKQAEEYKSKSDMVLSKVKELSVEKNKYQHMSQLLTRESPLNGKSDI